MSTASDVPSAAGDFDVVGLGFCCLDELLLLERIPRAEEQVTVHERALEGGGMAATAMVAVTRLGGRAAFIGAVGDDATGAQIRQGFESAGVDVTQLWLHPGTTSNRTFVLVDRRNAARSFLAQFGSCGAVPPGHLDRQYLRRGRILHLSDPRTGRAASGNVGTRQRASGLLRWHPLPSRRPRAPAARGLSDRVALLRTRVCTRTRHPARRSACHSGAGAPRPRPAGRGYHGRRARGRLCRAGQRLSRPGLRRRANGGHHGRRRCLPRGVSVRAVTRPLGT